MEYVFGLLIYLCILTYCKIKDKEVGTMEFVFGLLIYIMILIYCKIKDKQYEQSRKK